MKTFAKQLRGEEIAYVTQGIAPKEITGSFNNVGEAGEANTSSVVFCEQEKLVESVVSSSAGLVITNEKFAPAFAGRSLLITDKPYFSFMRLVAYWLSMEEKMQSWGIHPTAIVDDSAHFEGEVAIGAYAVVGANVSLGKGVVIGDACSVASGSSIGAGTKLYPNVKVYEDCVIGRKCIIHSGVVIGADGFGFLLMDGIQVKIPQVGNVVIHDDVEIGANSCIDRATLGSTIIGRGTKIDNLVQIGHNCVVGEHSILCSQVGLAGSTIVGDYVYLAGQVGAAGHITIGSRVMVGAQSGIAASIPAGAKYFGTPAIDANTMKRIIVAQKYLPEMYRSWVKQNKEDHNE